MHLKNGMRILFLILHGKLHLMHCYFSSNKRDDLCVSARLICDKIGAYLLYKSSRAYIKKNAQKNPEILLGALL